MSLGVTDIRGVFSGAWWRAELLKDILMEGLNHDVAGFIDWNLILDSKGGPAYVNSGIDAFILVNEDFTAFHKQPVFYIMAHFAKFIPRHSLRVNAKFSGSSKSHVQTVAYLTPYDKIVIVLYNNDTNSVDFELRDALKGKTTLSLKPKSINTIIY